MTKTRLNTGRVKMDAKPRVVEYLLFQGVSRITASDTQGLSVSVLLQDKGGRLFACTARRTIVTVEKEKSGVQIWTAATTLKALQTDTRTHPLDTQIDAVQYCATLEGSGNSVFILNGNVRAIEDGIAIEIGYDTVIQAPFQVANVAFYFEDDVSMVIVREPKPGGGAAVVFTYD